MNMRDEYGRERDAPTVESLPTPGALREWGNCWVPTLDGQPISAAQPFSFESREEAWAEAIRWLKHRAGLALQVVLGSQTGCVVMGGGAVIVETVAEARKVILGHAMNSLGDHARNPRHREHLRLRGHKARPTWEDLAGCETHRRYDPDEPDAGMRCDYVLYEEGDLDGVGGLVWTYGVDIWATAPPEVWDHPADLPCGLGADDDPFDGDRSPSSPPAD